MNREQMIAWLTLEGWYLSCNLSNIDRSFFIKKLPPDYVRLVVYDAAEDRDSGYAATGPYSPGSEVDEVTRFWEEVDDARVARAYEEATHAEA